MDFDNTLKKCPDCGESIKIEARLCRFCNYQFTQEEIEESKQRDNERIITEKYEGSDNKNSQGDTIVWLICFILVISLIVFFSNIILK